jgi:hypothetical protein
MKKRLVVIFLLLMGLLCANIGGAGSKSVAQTDGPPCSGEWICGAPYYWDGGGVQPEGLYQDCTCSEAPYSEWINRPLN